MRHRSLTNSHKHVNEDLRREYATIWNDDQIAFELGIVLKDNLGFTAMYVGCKIEATETNHIWSLGRRPDLVSNLIRLSAAAHRYFHRNLTVGRILCMCAKARLRDRCGLPDEFNVADLSKVSGKDILGWTECAVVPPWVERYRQELIVAITSHTIDGAAGSATSATAPIHNPPSQERSGHG